MTDRPPFERCTAEYLQSGEWDTPRSARIAWWCGLVAGLVVLAGLWVVGL